MDVIPKRSGPARGPAPRARKARTKIAFGGCRGNVEPVVWLLSQRYAARLWAGPRRISWHFGRSDVQRIEDDPDDEQDPSDDDPDPDDLPSEVDQSEDEQD